MLTTLPPILVQTESCLAILTPFWVISIFVQDDCAHSIQSIKSLDMAICLGGGRGEPFSLALASLHNLSSQ